MGISLWFNGFGFFIIYILLAAMFLLGRSFFHRYSIDAPSRNSFIFFVSTPLSLYMLLEWHIDGGLINFRGIINFCLSFIILSQAGWIAALLGLLGAILGSHRLTSTGFWIAVISALCHIPFLMLAYSLAFSS